MKRIAVLLLASLLLLPAPLRVSAAREQFWFDNASVAVAGGAFRDEHRREVVFRGFNVSGEAKLAELRGLPFATVTDARSSAASMRRLTGANAVRFLVTWAWVEPEPRKIDHRYLTAVAEQIAAFTDQGIRVYVDFHQDLYSRYLFNRDSWYTGDGAPEWVVRAGNYPRESCGLCFHWGQNMKNNQAVTSAVYDFWHNREVTTPAGPIKIRDEFLYQASETMRFLKENLSPNAFRLILGVDPLNEPYAGRYDTGQNGPAWERDLLWPFYQQFRQRMDQAGWADKAAFVEPLVFWNQNVEFFAEPGGLTAVPALGSRFVFNSHFYDGKAQSGVLKPGKANDGEYTADFNRIRDRAKDLGTTGIVSEFGHPVAGFTSDKAPTVLKAMYQALDSRVKGANWWSGAAESGHALSASQWHWDIYYDRHRELMNDNPDKVQTEGDAMNGEHFSAVRLSNGSFVTTVDSRLIDRLFPRAVAGDTLAFGYEDRSVGTWNPVPATMPTIRQLVGTGQYAMFVWRSNGSEAPTELHLPASFGQQNTTVVSDLASTTGLPPYTGTQPVAIAPEPGEPGVNRLMLSSSDTGRVHFALVTNGSGTPPTESARSELASWVAETFH
ncbi:cellulase family glycosylhydrolase [Kibdelosporangium aridum]|uniref:Cellulase (Glycosyl hydrolase family 5) n=1 Tax=Kibdelosporangium aridum TaxID=2030 RepID=A0A1Y5Y2Z8_KIBAR|nr:cellulase family glycosylhydrolase [Kibdelosporangium aridum]SMD22831.1 Cellulase (glycosyl hydrolase family 5) [Kibdelosporangium aridum]